MCAVVTAGEYMSSPLDITEQSVPVMKVMQIFVDIRTYNLSGSISESKTYMAETNWSLIYLLMMLATNLMCTLFIVYRIVRLAQRIFLFRSIFLH